MQQAIHIFKKDVRHLRIEICLTMVLTVAFMPLWPFAAAFLVARLIHAEAIRGQNQFWITRPYRWTSLIAAKLLFIAAFIHLPVLAVQSWQLIHGWGFEWHAIWTGLIWSQLLFVLCFSLPSAALAAITPGLTSFVLLEIILAALVFSTSQSSTLGYQFRRAWPDGVDWIPEALVVAIASLAVGAILILQFRRRKTLLSGVIAAAATLAGLAIYLYLPPQFALNAQASLSKQRIDTSSVGLALVPGLRDANLGFSNRVQLKFPMMVSGLPESVEIRADAVAGQLRTSSGAILPVYVNGSDIVLGPSKKTVIETVVLADSTFVDAHRDEGVTLSAAFYISLFGDPHSETITLARESRTVMDGFRCSTLEFENLVGFGCRTPFRWPDTMVYAKTGEGDLHPFYRGISYAPFPAELRVMPMAFHSTMITQSLAPRFALGPAKTPTVTIVAKQALAHLRRDVELTIPHLGDLTDDRPVWLQSAR
jgi:hypothetical protein